MVAGLRARWRTHATSSSRTGRSCRVPGYSEGDTLATRRMLLQKMPDSCAKKRDELLAKLLEADVQYADDAAQRLVQPCPD